MVILSRPIPRRKNRPRPMMHESNLFLDNDGNLKPGLGLGPYSCNKCFVDLVSYWTEYMEQVDKSPEPSWSIGAGRD